MPVADMKRRRRKLLRSNADRSGGRVVPDWSALVRRDGTAVIYLRGADYAAVADAAIRSGLPHNAPCVLVSSVGRPGQQIFTTSLRHLASVAGLPVPAIIIIGDAAPAPKDELVSQFCRQIVGAAVDRNDPLDRAGQSAGDSL